MGPLAPRRRGGSIAAGQQALSDASNVGSDIAYATGGGAEVGAVLDIFSATTDVVSFGADILAGNNVRQRLGTSALKLIPGISFYRVGRATRAERSIARQAVDQLSPPMVRRCTL